MITSEQVQARLAALRQQREQVMAQLRLYEGAIQDCEYWLQISEQNELPLGEELPDNVVPLKKPE